MSEAHDLHAVDEISDRIEQLLDALGTSVIPRDFRRMEEVVRLVTELYGAGLERMLDLVRQAAPDLVGRLAADPLVAGLLCVHDIHPEPLEVRVERALDSVRPFLQHHDGDVELLDIDEEAAAVHLRLLGSCDGCPSSSVTLELAVERAIRDAAPEITSIDVEAREATIVPAGASNGGGMPIALGRKPGYDSCPSEVVAVAR
jgi:Fe-S cluster biogenesis protein NfuA